MIRHQQRVDISHPPYLSEHNDSDRLSLMDQNHLSQMMESLSSSVAHSVAIGNGTAGLQPENLKLRLDVLELRLQLNAREEKEKFAEIEQLKTDIKKLIDENSLLNGEVETLTQRIQADKQQFKNIRKRLEGVITEMKKSQDKTSSENRKLADQISSIEQTSIQTDKSLPVANFQFKIENFSKLRGDILSPPTYVRNFPWRIWAEPWTACDGKKYLAVHLHCGGPQESSARFLRWSVRPEFELRLLSQKEGVESVKKKYKDEVFRNEEPDCKLYSVLIYPTWNDICDPSKGFIKDDTVILEAYVKADVPVID